MVVIGVILVIAGAVGVLLATRARKRVHAMIAAETLPSGELEMLRRASDEVGGGGHFRKVCEVIGTVEPAPDGPLTSELTSTQCVWHSHRIQRRYRHVSHDSHGRRRTTQRTETVAEHTSIKGFGLRDSSGTVGVDPNGIRPDGVEQVTDRFEPVERSGSSGFLGTIGRLSGWNSDDTIGYQYTEWVLRPGTQLYVLGEVHDKIGPLVIAKPEQPGDPFIISTRSEDQLRKSSQTQQLALAWGGAAAGALGLVLAVIGLLG